MRWLVLALLAGCGPDGPLGPEPLEPDAAPEPVQLLEGEYELSWLCVEGCGIGTPPMATYNRLERIGSELRWSTEGTTNVNADIVVLERDGCVGGSGLAFGAAQDATEPYEFCPEPGDARAEIAWMSRYGPQLRRVWTAVATPR